METFRDAQGGSSTTNRPHSDSRAPELLRQHYLVLQERSASGLGRLIGDRRQHKVITYRVREVRVDGERAVAKIERRRGGRWEELPRGLVQSASGWQHVMALARMRLREEHPDARRLSIDEDKAAP